MSTPPHPHRVLITGGAGFIGVNLIKELERTSRFEITVLDNESIGKAEDINSSNVRFVQGDIIDQAIVHEAMKNAHSVIHLAADTRIIDSIDNPNKNFEINVKGTFELLCAARELGVKRFINASSGGAILGPQSPPIHENMLPNPISPYGAAKHAAEGYCSAFHGAYDLNTLSLRFSNIYGPGSLYKNSVVAHFIKSIICEEPLTVYGDGTQTRDFLFVGDLVHGIRLFLESTHVGIYQLGSGDPTPLSELIDILRETTGKEYPFDVQFKSFRKGEITHNWCDIDRARSAIGFEPSVRLREGIETTWRWFKDQEYDCP